jgi:hypothetical protein
MVMRRKDRVPSCGVRDYGIITFSGGLAGLIRVPRRSADVSAVPALGHATLGRPLLDRVAVEDLETSGKLGRAPPDTEIPR